jgi:hypothetical protein
MIIKISKKKN